MTKRETLYQLISIDYRITEFSPEYNYVLLLQILIIELSTMPD